VIAINKLIKTIEAELERNQKRLEELKRLIEMEKNAQATISQKQYQESYNYREGLWS